MTYSRPGPDVSAAMRPGDTPSGTAWANCLWIIVPAMPSPSQDECLMVLRTKVRGQENLFVYEARTHNVRGFEGRIYPLVRATDIAGLYAMAHRSRVAVIALGSAKVLLDISERPSNGGCMSLERFVRYKCSFCHVTRPEEVDSALVAAMDWMVAVHSEGPSDPRCLPAAIFETRREYSLETHEQRRAFIAAHKNSKRSSGLTDVRGRTWQVGPPHTRDLLQVAGFTLPVGFHWDVQAQRDSVIATGWERWELPGRGYTNVHPDAFVRGGNATRTHRESGMDDKTRLPRTPRNARQRKRRK